MPKRRSLNGLTLRRMKSAWQPIFLIKVRRCVLIPELRVMSERTRPRRCSLRLYSLFGLFSNSVHLRRSCRQLPQWHDSRWIGLRVGRRAPCGCSTILCLVNSLDRSRYRRGNHQGPLFAIRPPPAQAPASPSGVTAKLVSEAIFAVSIRCLQQCTAPLTIRADLESAC